MKQHEKIHTGEKKFSCDVCSKKFAQSCNLKKHKRSHTGEKPYTCEICKKTFVDGTTLVEHKRRHTGEKPYSCDLCQKAFITSKDLSIHKRIHTGEKPYSCHICEVSFRSRATLTNHNKSARHLDKMISSTFIDYSEVTIKEEIKEEIFDDDPLSIQIKTEKNDEIEDPLLVESTQNLSHYKGIY